MTRSFHDLIGQLRQDSNTACQSHEYKRSKFTPCTQGGTWRKWQEEEGRKLERTGALAGHRHGFISEIKMDVVNIGTIAVNITSETHVAAKAVSRDASYCVHHEMCSRQKIWVLRGWEFPCYSYKMTLQCMSPNIYDTPVCHMLFSSRLSCSSFMYCSHFMSESFSI